MQKNRSQTNHGEHLLKDLSDTLINFNDIQDGLDKKNIRADSYLSPPNSNKDITNNYRRLYRGTGSIYDPETENYFYDIGYSYIIDSSKWVLSRVRRGGSRTIGEDARGVSR